MAVQLSQVQLVLKAWRQIDLATMKSVANGTQTKEAKMGQGVSTETEDKATQTGWLWLDKVKVNEEWDIKRRAHDEHIYKDTRSLFYYAKDIP